MSCLRRSSASTTSGMRDKRVPTHAKTKIKQTLHIVLWLWLVVSGALMLTAFSRRHAIIELLRTALSASMPATLPFHAPPCNPWICGAQGLVRDLPIPDAGREKEC